MEIGPAPYPSYPSSAHWPGISAAIPAQSKARHRFLAGSSAGSRVHRTHAGAAGHAVTGDFPRCACCDLYVHSWLKRSHFTEAHRLSNAPSELLHSVGAADTHREDPFWRHSRLSVSLYTQGCSPQRHSLSVAHFGANGLAAANPIAWRSDGRCVIRTPGIPRLPVLPLCATIQSYAARPRETCACGAVATSRLPMQDLW